MPKKLYLQPNLRIDETDVQSIVDGPNDTQKNLTNKVFLDTSNYVADGLRVEIPDQGSSPGEFTVHNGVAFDRAGQLLNDEDDPNFSVTDTINADGTYYVEVIYDTEQTDSATRAYMDPTYSNGLESPSGDPRVPGREVTNTAATRTKQTWTLVSPISTTGFDKNTNANSIKVPVCTLSVAGGIITNTGVAPQSPRSTLREAVSIGDSKFTVNDSRLMNSTGSFTVGAESVTITANDTVNGILTISGTFSSDHVVGERVIQGAANPVFLRENKAAVYTPAASSIDVRSRFWGGNEEHGYSLTQDPALTSGRSDCQIKNLKNHVDTMSAQIREMKFGSQLSTGLGKTSPPNTFSASGPRWYDAGASIQGAKSNTVSIGDGVTCFGDFNANVYASDDLAFQAAINALPATGGTVLVKGSGYIFENTVDLDTKPVIMIVETPIPLFPATAHITGSLASNAVPFTFINYFRLVGVVVLLEAGSTALAAITSTAASSGTTCTLILENSAVEAINTDSGCAYAGYALNSYFIGANVLDMIKGIFQNYTFDNCLMYNYFDNINSTCFLFKNNTASTEHVTIKNCLVSLQGASVTKAAIIFEQSASDAYNIVIENCDITNSGAALAINTATNTSSITKLLINNCNLAQGIRFQCSLTESSFSNNTIDLGDSSDISALKFNNLTGTSIVNNNVLHSDATSNPSSIYIVGTSTNNFIQGNSLIGVGYGIKMDGNCTGTRIINNRIAGAGSKGTAGIYIDSFTTSSIVNNQITNMLKVSTSNYGIYLNFNSIINITDNLISVIGTSTGTGTTAGIRTNQTSYAKICNNTIENVNSGATSCGINIVPGGTSSPNNTIANNSVSLIGTNSTMTYGIQVNDIFKSTITGNIVDGAVGSATCIGLYIAAITYSADSMVVTNNTVKALTGTTNSSGIFCTGQFNNLAVNSNNLHLTTANTSGIAVSGSSTYTLTNTSINNNIIGSTAANGPVSGIVCDFGTFSSALKTGMSVNSNTILGTVTGIKLSVASGSNIYGNVGVNNNTINSSIASDGAGIYLLRGNYASITGNSVTLTGAATTTNGIFTDIVNYISITGNMVTVAPSTNAFGIHTGTATTIAINGNTIVGLLCTLGTQYGISTAASTTAAMISGNIIVGYTAPAVGLDDGGTTTVSTLLVSKTNNGTEVGGANTQLNWVSN